MKKWLPVLLFCALPAFGQLEWFPILQSGAPSNPCGVSQISINTANGDLYTCNGTTWVKTGSGGGAGTVTSVTFTGDGTVLSATPSAAVTGSGTVTGALANAAAGTLLGNSTGGSAAPSYGTYASFGLVTGSAPTWLQYLGNGADGANTTASGSLSGELFYTNFTVPFGNTVTVNQVNGLTIHATGTCTIAGTINARGTDQSNAPTGTGGGSGGGSGGGTLAGAAGGATFFVAATGVAAAGGGTAGASSGGAGAAGNTPTASSQRRLANSGSGVDGAYSGGNGAQGGSTGGAAGKGGVGVVLICNSLTGSDGSHTGTIDVSGAIGVNSAANSTGSGSGGGGGAVILSSHTITNAPNIYVAGGPGGLCTVPQAIWIGGSCTTPPKATLAVSGGAISGACTVAQAGAGCGTGAGTTLVVQGGGGTLGTGTVTPTYSGGALASCSITAGNSSGYTASTFTTCGAGGDAAPGWSMQYTGW